MQETDDDYRALQQPETVYDTPAPDYLAMNDTGGSSAQPGAGGAGGSTAGSSAGKTYTLPDAETNWSQNFDRIPRVSKLPLFIKKVDPKYNQIKQRLIENCYLAATLASMANTKTGRALIKKMVKEQKGAITTTCKTFPSFSTTGTPAAPLTSDRWFTVSFKNSKQDVSDVLYHDDSDRDPGLFYLSTPNGDQALWGSIFEVAYASLKGSYNNISASNGATIDVFLGEFSSLTWEILFPDKDEPKIKKACLNSGIKPAFIATLQTTKILTHWHGLAVLKMKGTKVTLWDPLAVKEIPIEYAEMLTEIQAIAVAK